MNLHRPHPPLRGPPSPKGKAFWAIRESQLRGCFAPKRRCNNEPSPPSSTASRSPFPKGEGFWAIRESPLRGRECRGQSAEFWRNPEGCHCEERSDVAIRILTFRRTDSHIVEAQDTMFHFLQAENSTSILASPLPHKAGFVGPPFRPARNDTDGGFLVCSYWSRNDTKAFPFGEGGRA